MPRKTATPLLLTSAILLVLVREAALTLLFWGYALVGFGHYLTARVTAPGKELPPGLDERSRR